MEGGCQKERRGLYIRFAALGLLFFSLGLSLLGNTAAVAMGLSAGNYI